MNHMNRLGKQNKRYFYFLNKRYELTFYVSFENFFLVNMQMKIKYTL